jgi:capsule polysaccharide export protein KpsE/RkpR
MSTLRKLCRAPEPPAYISSNVFTKAGAAYNFTINSFNDGEFKDMLKNQPFYQMTELEGDQTRAAYQFSKMEEEKKKANKAVEAVLKNNQKVLDQIRVEARETILKTANKRLQDARILERAEQNMNDFQDKLRNLGRGMDLRNDN